MSAIDSTATSAPVASSSKPVDTPRKSPSTPVHTLVLDAGPILSLTPLRGMAECFVAPPQVIAELRDEKARQYWDRIQAGLIEGVEIEIKAPDAISLSKVIAFAQKTGDYAVLSKPDLAVLALTYAMDAEKKSSPASTSSRSGPSMPTTLSPEQPKESAEESQLAGPSTSTNIAGPSTAPKASPWGAVKKPVEVEQSEQVGDKDDEDADEEEEEAFPALPTGPSERQEGDDEADRKAVEAHLAEMNITPSARSGDGSAPPVQTEREKRIEELRREMQEEEARKQQFQQVYAEDDDEEAGEDGWDDSGAGEWITPENVTKHKAEDLGLLPTTRTEAGRSAGSGSAVTEGTTGTLPEVKKKKKKRAPRKPQAQVGVACFTGDYAVQNVLVQMGLGLVGEGGKRIKSVKSWVLRCHACFKLCKDPSKKFCPSCGGPTLIRASITTHAPTPSDPNPRVEVHLKQNFQYRTRGTVYSIPSPKMGSSKSASNGNTLILREDQKEFQRGLKREEGRRWKEDKELERAVKAQMEGKGAGLGSWNDPDWLPEILTTGSSGKGRRTGGEGLPTVGYGRKNPNEARRRKK